MSWNYVIRREGLKKLGLVRVLLLVVTSQVLVSCSVEHNPVEEEGAGVLGDLAEVKSESSSVTYRGDLLPIIKKKCVACHNPASRNGNWLDYQEVFDKREEIVDQVSQKTMPMGSSLDDDQIELFIEWIKDGASEGSKTEADGSSSDSEGARGERPEYQKDDEEEDGFDLGDELSGELSGEQEVEDELGPELSQKAEIKNFYIQKIRPLFQSQCVACHNENSPPTLMPNWMSYSTFEEKPEYAASIRDRINREEGTPGRMPPAGELDGRDEIEDWIDAFLKSYNE